MQNTFKSELKRDANKAPSCVEVRECPLLWFDVTTSFSDPVNHFRMSPVFHISVWGRNVMKKIPAMRKSCQICVWTVRRRPCIFAAHLIDSFLLLRNNYNVYWVQGHATHNGLNKKIHGYLNSYVTFRRINYGTYLVLASLLMLRATYNCHRVIDWLIRYSS